MVRPPRPGFPRVRGRPPYAKPPLRGAKPTEFQPRPPLAPVDNEIPDSANVQANPSPGANVPSSVENEMKETRQAQLNLGN